MVQSPESHTSKVIADDAAMTLYIERHPTFSLEGRCSVEQRIVLEDLTSFEFSETWNVYFIRHREKSGFHNHGFSLSMVGGLLHSSIVCCSEYLTWIRVRLHWYRRGRRYCDTRRQASR
nr:uncharacterized protein LOC129380215 [Dermacentor andersoni]